MNGCACVPVLAGASFYTNDEVLEIVNVIANMRTVGSMVASSTVKVDGFGSFSFRKAHPTWVAELLLGALDFYDVEDVPAFQIVPERVCWTVDIPDLSKPWSPAEEPVWQWLNQPWTYSVPKQSVAVTNLDALRGGRVTEACRWEEDEWEIFSGAGPEVEIEDIRSVPLATLLGFDKSLEPVVNLQVNRGVWRDDQSDWHPWVRSV